MKILIIGNGYIGQRCAEEWPDADVWPHKIYSVDDAQLALAVFEPDVVLNAAGVRGRPNVDWCETHREVTAFGNVSLPLMIAEACKLKGIYLLHIGSGCVFYGESPDPRGWAEADFANPISYYSKTKYAADLALDMDNVGIARIRVPLDDRSNSTNIIDKLIAYPKVIDVANSLTVIPDMVKVFRQLLEKKGQGIFHVTNPGAIAYRKIIELYDPALKKDWISEEELVSAGLTEKQRSTNTMQSTRLEAIGIQMPPIDESVAKVMKQFKENI